MIDSVKLGELFAGLAEDQAQWSQETFGPDTARDGQGPLKHLILEAAVELLGYDKAAAKSFLETAPRQFDPAAMGDRSEWADVLILLLDSSRRSGLNPTDLVTAARDKMRLNRQRKWGVPVDGQPVEHLPGTGQPTPAELAVLPIGTKLSVRLLGEVQTVRLTRHPWPQYGGGKDDIYVSVEVSPATATRPQVTSAVHVANVLSIGG